MMNEGTQDKLARALSTLTALRDNVANMSWVREVFVQEYHHVLDELEGIGLDVKQFRVPASEIKPQITSFGSLTGMRTYSEEKYVDKELLLIKLDSIIGYFKLRGSRGKPTIGFSPPDTQ